MVLVPVKERFEDNEVFITHPKCMESLDMSVKFFANVGYYPPWIGYYAQLNGTFVGGAAFKGKPRAGKVEIAYTTFPNFQRQGVGSRMCQKLVELALHTDPLVIIAARTLTEESFSTRILKKNNFKCLGIVVDEDDGEVWEWEYDGTIN